MGGTPVDDMWAGQVGMGVAVDKRRERDISVWWDADADQAQDEAAAGHRRRPYQGHTQTRIRSPHADTQTQIRRCRHGTAPSMLCTLGARRTAYGVRQAHAREPSRATQSDMAWRRIISPKGSKVQGRRRVGLLALGFTASQRTHAHYAIIP